MKELSQHQQDTLDAVSPADTDIDIAVIYTRVYGDPGVLSAREMQQKLAPTFKAVNDKLAENKETKKCRIEPGDTKRTYRYTTKHVG